MKPRSKSVWITPAACGDVELRLHREEEERLEHRVLLLRQLGRACGSAGVQDFSDLLQGGNEALRFLVAAGLRDLGVLRELLIDRLQICESQFDMHGFDV